jgi:hypothetical protein
MKDIREFLNEPEDIQFKNNPLIPKINQILKKFERMAKIHKIDDPKVQVEDGLIHSDSDDPFENSHVKIKLKYKYSKGREKEIEQSINTEEFENSPFDTLMAFAAIKAKDGFISFPIIEQEKQEDDEDKDVENLGDKGGFAEKFTLLNKIQFIKVVDQTTFVFLNDGSYYKSNKTLNDFRGVLEKYGMFKHIHKSYLVNMHYFDMEIPNNSTKEILIKTPTTLDQKKLAKDLNEAKKEPEDINQERRRNFLKDNSQYYFRVPVRRQLQAKIFDLWVESHSKEYKSHKENNFDSLKKAMVSRMKRK